MVKHLVRPICLLVLLLIALGAPQPASAAPPLYKVQAGSATVYLFGTFHALPEAVDAWLTPVLKRALASAHTVVFEIDPATMAGPQAQAIALKRGLVFDDMTLDKRLPPDLFAKVVEAAGKFGLPAAGMRQLQPWLAALTLTQLQIKAQGFDQEQGAEMQLYRLLRRDKVNVTGLETIERQIGFFADLPMDQQVDMVRESLEEAEQTEALLTTMKTAWLAGDEAALVTLLNDKLKSYPHLYDVLMRKRNDAWLAPVRTLLTKKGTAVIAVGTAHLVGDDSVVALLRRAGYRVERVNH